MLHNHYCLWRKKSSVTIASEAINNLIVALNSTVTMVNESLIIGLVVCYALSHYATTTTISTVKMIMIDWCFCGTWRAVCQQQEEHFHYWRHFCLLLGNLNCPDNRSLSSAKVVFVWTIIVIFYMCLRDIVAVEVLPKSSVKQIIMH